MEATTVLAKLPKLGKASFALRSPLPFLSSSPSSSFEDPTEFWVYQAAAKAATTPTSPTVDPTTIFFPAPPVDAADVEVEVDSPAVMVTVPLTVAEAPTPAEAAAVELELVVAPEELVAVELVLVSMSERRRGKSERSAIRRVRLRSFRMRI